MWDWPSAAGLAILGLLGCGLQTGAGTVLNVLRRTGGPYGGQGLQIGGFQSFKTARRTIAGFEAMLWLRKGFGFSGDWTVNDQNELLARLFGLQEVNKG
jgi:hypothetical protein